MRKQAAQPRHWWGEHCQHILKGFRGQGGRRIDLPPLIKITGIAIVFGRNALSKFNAIKKSTWA